MNEFFRLHASGSEMAGTVHHNDLFATAPAAPFLVEVCEGFARNNELRIFRLHVGGAVVACRIGFELNGGLYLYYSGFDSTDAHHGVMTTALAEDLRWAIDQRCSLRSISNSSDPLQTPLAASGS